MVNFEVLKRGREKYPIQEIPFLTEARQRAVTEKKYAGLKILHNLPLTLESVVKVEVLLLAGADVTVSAMSVLPPHPEALEILRAANVKVILDRQFEGEFDFHLDCGAELIKIHPPKRGAVELTQTGTVIYKNKSYAYPCISVDDSKIKILETFFGIGEEFVQALQAMVDTDIRDRKFVVFGYGKVGKGIVRALKNFTQNIVVIDIASEQKEFAARQGVVFIDGNGKDKVKQAVTDAFCVVTATGVKNLISDFYQLNKADFGKAYLAHMGGADEYGKNFLATDVLYNKKTLNFSLSKSLIMKYLDPIFYAHNMGIDLMLSQQMQSGYHSFPNDLAEIILAKWCKFHGENIQALEDGLF